MPYTKDLYQYTGDELFLPLATPSVFQESVGDQQPGAGETFTLDSAEVTVVYELEFSKRRAFLQWCLGFAAVARDTTNNIVRSHPQRHPYYTEMRAASCSFSGFPPKVEGGVLWLASPFPEFNAGSIGSINRYANYQKCYATVRYASMPWEFLNDDVIVQLGGTGPEVYRYTFVDLAPSVEMLSAESELGQMVWRETAAGGPTVDVPVPAPFGTLVSKTTLVLNWMQVPEQWLSVGTGTDFYPTKILNCVGKMNSATFLGKPAGTLLMQPPRFKRFRWPVVDTNGDGTFFGYDVQIPLQFFDPPKGVASAFRGYQLLPWSKDLLWYKATRSDPTKYLLNEADFATAFARAV